MNNKFRYLVLALLVSLNLNAGTADSKDGNTGNTGNAHVGCNHDHNDDRSEDGSEENSDGGLLSGIIASAGDIATNGITGVETFVGNHKVAVAGGATFATVVAIYALYKWKKSADRVLTLEEELEEANAIIA